VTDAADTETAPKRLSGIAHAIGAGVCGLSRTRHATTILLALQFWVPVANSIASFPNPFFFFFSTQIARHKLIDVNKFVLSVVFADVPLHSA
jgi:hypothetical protein